MTKSLDLFIHFWIFACELFVAKKVASVVLTKKGPKNHSGNEAKTLLFLQREKAKRYDSSLLVKNQSHDLWLRSE